MCTFSYLNLLMHHLLWSIIKSKCWNTICRTEMIKSLGSHVLWLQLYQVKFKLSTLKKYISKEKVEGPVYEIKCEECEVTYVGDMEVKIQRTWETQFHHLRGCKAYSHGTIWAYNIPFIILESHQPLITKNVSNFMHFLKITVKFALSIFHIWNP